MKTDLYTKAILTVIAICLTIIVLKQVDIIPDVHAENNTSMKNPSLSYGIVPMNPDGSINVNIKSTSSTMDVNLVDISTTGELDVNIDEVGGYSTYGKLPVEIK